MIISHTHKFIFVHIPKCGGTSITKALLPYLQKDDLVLGVKNDSTELPMLRKINRGISLLQTLPIYLKQKYLQKNPIKVGLSQFAKHQTESHHKNGMFIMKHSEAIKIRNYIDQEVWDNYLKFAFVRNPWDRVVSSYFWIHEYNWQDNKGFMDKIRELPDFSSYVKSEFLGNPSIRLTKPCTAFVFDSERKIVDFVGKQENLEQDFAHICRQIGLPKIRLPKTNFTSREKDYRQYYNQETRQIVLDKYKDDVANFNYVF